MAKIDLSNISHTYNPLDPKPTYALNPFSMTWENGKRYAILGPSGCGKTTMLNIVSGLAGQINLAHGVFVGIGTYTSAVLGGVATRSVIGYELDMLIWLPLSGIVAAIVGVIISPIAVRLKGLNLALVTLALVFVGSHIFSNMVFITNSIYHYRWLGKFLCK